MEALFDFFNKVSPVSFAFAGEDLDVFGVDAQPTKLTGSWTRIWIRRKGGIGHRGGRGEWRGRGGGEWRIINQCRLLKDWRLRVASAIFYSCLFIGKMPRHSKLLG